MGISRDTFEKAVQDVAGIDASLEKVSKEARIKLTPSLDNALENAKDILEGTFAGINTNADKPSGPKGP